MSDSCNDRFFHNLCRQAGLALIATDEQLNIRFWNDSAARMLGGSAEEMIGRPIASIVPDDRRELAERLCERTLTRGEIGELEFDYRNTLGDALCLAVTLSPITTEQSQRIGVSVFVRDVTRRMDLERSAAHQQKMAALGTMAGQVAHHFNNVLGGIITSLDFAQGHDNPDILRRAMRTAMTALSRANRLTQGLLAFAEGDRSECPLDDLSQVVQRFLVDLAPRLAEEQVRLETDVDPIKGLVPSRRVTTILEHLSANAREAMAEGGALRIELKPFGDEPKAILRVADTGCGITPENLPRVFEPFFTTKCEQYDAAQHAGLGLAVVHGIVKEMGGSVSLCSTMSGGTVCSVVLPLKNRPVG